MNKYIIYTPEGYTEDPRGNDIWNCQVLGRAKGNDPDEAIENLLKDNEWITKDGYDRDEFIVARLHESEYVDYENI